MLITNKYLVPHNPSLVLYYVPFERPHHIPFFHQDPLPYFPCSWNRENYQTRIYIINFPCLIFYKAQSKSSLRIFTVKIYIRDINLYNITRKHKKYFSQRKIIKNNFLNVLASQTSTLELILKNYSINKIKFQICSRKINEIFLANNLLAEAGNRDLLKKSKIYNNFLICNNILKNKKYFRYTAIFRKFFMILVILKVIIKRNLQPKHFGRHMQQ